MRKSLHRGGELVLGKGILPSTRNGRLLAVGATVDSVGTGMFLAVATLYFVRVVGLSPAAVGTTLGVANAIGLVSPLFVARFADRYGASRTYVVLMAVRGIGYLAYAFVAGLAAYAVLACLLTAADRASTPVFQATVAQVEAGRDRVRTLAAVRSLRNLGLTAGFLVAGLVQSLHVPGAFQALMIGNGLSFAVVAALVTVIDRSLRAEPGLDPDPAREAPARAVAPGARSPLRDVRFLALALGSGLLELHDSVLFVLLPLWVVERAGLPTSTGSLFLAVNTALTIVLQVRVSRRVDGASSALRVIKVAGAVLVLACAGFAVAEHAGTVIAFACTLLAVVLVTLGENLHVAAGWELSLRFAPPPARARYLAVFSMGSGAQLVVGPLLMTMLVLPGGAPGWCALAALLLLAVATIARAVPGLSASSGGSDRPPIWRTS